MMNTRNLLILSSLILGSNFALLAQKTPNVVFILTDDQGYQDLGCYHSPLIKTPRIDQMAKEGLRLTDYYVTSSVSSASRAGIMTGRMNTHNGVVGVLWPGEEGLALDQITMAEALKKQGYATACFGKWHLGDTEGHWPTSRGFDTYLGIPYSNDMYIGPTQKISKKVVFREGFDLAKTKDAQKRIPGYKRNEIMKNNLKDRSPLLENDEIIEYPVDQTTLTRRYFDKAIQFIDQSGDKPFFIYLTPNMPHTPLHASKQFKGKSARGLYGDVVEELDWNVGRLLDYLDKKGLSDNTLVVFTSDNGPWLSKKEDGGSALPLRDGKFSQYEGGVRTPCIIRWKGKIPANKTSHSMFESIDWFPTILNLAGGKASQYKLDGMDQMAFLKNPTIQLRDEYLYVKNGKITGIRKGDWIYLPMTGKSNDPKRPELFNVKLDIEQNRNLHEQNPQKVKELKKLMDEYAKTVYDQ